MGLGEFHLLVSMPCGMLAQSQILWVLQTLTFLLSPKKEHSK